MDACQSRDWLDARGFSVTLPHKVHALRYLGDRVDSPADLIGAVNTIRFDDGEVWGCNTDCDAAVDTLLAAMECGQEDLADVPVDVLGAGGVSRAVVAGLTDCGCSVTVYNRDLDRARSLAQTIECEVRPWEERVGADGKILVNCTSVGMWPHADASPMPADALRPDTVVFDMVYRPRETRLLRDAKSAGCRTVEGLGMFVRQAVMQFEYWTQQSADFERFAAAVEQALSSEGPT
jgi:shikimate dehydrogenase